MFLRICSNIQLRPRILLMQFSLNNPFYNTNNQFSRTGQLAAVKRDFYSDLKVPRNAIQRDIQETYTALSKQYQAQIGAGVKDAAEKLKRLNQAYYVLGNVDRKRLYDKGLTSFSKNLPEAVPAISDVKKSTSAAEPEPLKVTDKALKEYLDKKLGDLGDKVSHKERAEAIEAATKLFYGEINEKEELTPRPTKAPDTYTEKALRKLMRTGRFERRE